MCIYIYIVVLTSGEQQCQQFPWFAPHSQNKVSILPANIIFQMTFLIPSLLP